MPRKKHTEEYKYEKSSGSETFIYHQGILFFSKLLLPPPNFAWKQKKLNDYYFSKQCMVQNEQNTYNKDMRSAKKIPHLSLSVINSSLKARSSWSSRSLLLCSLLSTTSICTNERHGHKCLTSDLCKTEMAYLADVLICYLFCYPGRHLDKVGNLE